MHSVDQFATEAALFEQWARYGTAQGAVAAREAMVRLMRLYLAAMELPLAMSADSSDDTTAIRVGNEEWQEVLTTCARLPFDHYGEVPDPLVVPPGESVIGSLSDDVADIYRDVVTGLRAFRAGHRDHAIWEWQFNFGIHWGGHATGAIRALHCWLATSKNL
jgi:hypothetical protein